MVPKTALPESVKRCVAAATEAGLDIEVRMMSEPTRTAEEAAKACACDVAQIVKSLVFRGKLSGKPYLLLVSGKNRVNERAVSTTFGEPIERSSPEFVRKVTGYAIGGVAPLGHAVRMTVLMDQTLLDQDIVYAAAGTPNSLFSVSPHRLMRAVLARSIVME